MEWVAAKVDVVLRCYYKISMLLFKFSKFVFLYKKSMIIYTMNMKNGVDKNLRILLHNMYRSQY